MTVFMCFSSNSWRFFCVYRCQLGAGDVYWVQCLRKFEGCYLCLFLAYVKPQTLNFRIIAMKPPFFLSAIVGLSFAATAHAGSLTPLVQEVAVVTPAPMIVADTGSDWTGGYAGASLGGKCQVLHKQHSNTDCHKYIKMGI